MTDPNPAEQPEESRLIFDPDQVTDPIGDQVAETAANTRKNYARVGSARPTSLLYTYGPGSIMDLPHFTVLPTGLDEWEPVYRRRPSITPIHAPRLLDAVRTLVAYSVERLMPFPWQPKPSTFSQEGIDLGVPARVFPQWLRCTGCDLLAPLTAFDYQNTRRFRPDEAVFEHAKCYGRRPGPPGGSDGRRDGGRGPQRRPAVVARYLLACTDGHLDEFPYGWWVHQGGDCPKAQAPTLKMSERGGGRGATATIICGACGAKRQMSEAQGEIGRSKLPRCRGRHPHLDGFEPAGCALEPRLMVVGASNLWFPALQSIIDMPRLTEADTRRDDADRLRAELGDDLATFGDQVAVIRALLLRGGSILADRSDADLADLIALARQPSDTNAAEQVRRRDEWDPVDLLMPEWRYLLQEPARQFHADERSGLTLSPRDRGEGLPEQISRVLAVDRLRKVNALIGFTRIDELDRVNDLAGRLVQLSRTAYPTWTVATVDRGEGIFLQLDEQRVSSWEDRVEDSGLWTAHKRAHRRNFRNRFSETAERTDPDERFRPPRYWLLHTLGHSLFRMMALSSGYGAASLTERIYAWPAVTGTRPAAAGILICTTASDSDGTLGGLVRLSQPDLLARHVQDALQRAGRCSSDPVCAARVPVEPEDFLHGAACHCCLFASETSCERANRFLDRRLLVPIPGPWQHLAFFGS